MAHVIEHPKSLPSAPKYLSAEGNDAWRKFCWTEVHIHALRFARAEDAEQIAAISKTAQPDLWREVEQIGPPRICEHGWTVGN